MKTIFSFLLTVVLCCEVSFSAENVERFRGENEQGRYDEQNLSTEWPEGGPPQRWLDEEIGAGWGSVIKIGERLYLTGLSPDDKSKESVLCLNLDGKILWRTTTGDVWKKAYPCPRTTPTYYNGKLYVATGCGEIFCVDATSGKIVWSVPVAEKYASRHEEWGFAENLLVFEDKVFFNVDSEKVSVVALDAANGNVVWEAPDAGDVCAYVSPVLLGDQLICLNGKYVFGIDVRSGKMRWRRNFEADSGYEGENTGSNCNGALVDGNRFFVTEGYDQAGVMYELADDGDSAKIVWANPALDVHHGHCVKVDGRIYGSNWLTRQSGNWVCLDWETGKTIYETPWDKLGKGSIIFADGNLYLYEEKRGTVGLLRPSDKFEIVSEFQVKFGSKEHWAHPVICDGILYLRHGDALAAYDLRREKERK